MSLVMEHGDNWKEVGEKMGIKNKKDLILEFLKAPLKNEKYLLLHTSPIDQ